MTVVVATDDAVYEGVAIDLRQTDVGVETVTAAVRAEQPRDETVCPPDGGVTVTCPSPSQPYEALGHVGDADPSVRTLLAAAARSRGYTAPQRPQYDAVVERLEAVEVPAVDVASARKRVAEAGVEEDRLRERMATVRGRLQARRETGADTDAVAADLAETAARLSEVETERIAAEQALDRQERRAADARETRQHRLELQDRAANLERRMRESLAERVYPAFVDGLDALDGLDVPPDDSGDGPSDLVGDTPSDYAGDALTAQFGAVRLADLDAPVVVSTPVFEDARTAARRLDTAVILL